MAGSQSNLQGQLFVVETLMRHVARMTSLVTGVRRNQNIEPVHKMRVASRRLRGSLVLLQDYLPRKRFKTWYQLARRVTRSLGPARDTDVQIEAVDALLNELRERDNQTHQPGLERLRLRLTQKRQVLQESVLTTMDRLESGKGLATMRQKLLKMRVDAKLNKKSVTSDELRQRAHTEITRRLEKTLAYEPFITTPDHVEELHAMRIEAKRLRYCMETFAPLFDGKLKWQIKLVKGVQTRLGDIHDSDVWITFLPQFLDEEQARHEAFFGHRRDFRKIARGIEFFIARRQALRDDQYEDFRAHWIEQSKADAWLRLRDSLDVNQAPGVVGKISKQA